MNQIFTNLYATVPIEPHSHPTRGLPITFGMPAQGTISLDMYREIVQLLLESRDECERLHQRIAELEAQREGRDHG